ncbi:MAG: mannose-1-phosphate guanylyltransferase [Bacteroidaceae bacterium]|nr:mannose-1-phosphate guanylyltransferase [Bacteroidaceae bacterium]
MAGGVGSRFWPMSNEDRPKQFIDILGCGRTMLQLTADRFKGIVDPDNVWVVTSQRYADLVREQLPDIPAGNILLEPCMRGTASCICYVSWKIKKRDPRACVIVTPADHDVKDVEAFRQSIAESVEFASETDAIVTLGIKPTHPATGYGYIKADLAYSSSRKRNIYAADEFREKPNLETAKQYLAAKNYFWNSGIFVWSVSTIVNAFRVYAPQTSAIFEAMLPIYDTPEEQAHIDREFPKCENISVDYAIMEKSDDVYVRPSSFEWSDLGTWSSLHEQLPHDAYDNSVVGDKVSLFETSNCIVHTSGHRKVVVQGLDGYIVVEKDDALLICKMDEEQRIRLFH